MEVYSKYFTTEIAKPAEDFWTFVTEECYNKFEIFYM